MQQKQSKHTSTKSKQKNHNQSQHVQPQAENLQQKLLTKRYSIIDDMLSVRSSLQKQQIKSKLQKDKLIQLQKKILYLENIQHKNKIKGLHYQQKLDKLQQTQNMVVAMLGVKTNLEKEKQEILSIKKQFCNDFKTNLQENKQKSFSFFHKQKTSKIQRIKKQHTSYSLQRQKLSQSDMQYRRKLSSQIRQSQIQARQRLKRYEYFKLAQAKFNYQQRKEQAMQSNSEKLEILRNLKREIKQKEGIFIKTKALYKQVGEIQTLYITGV